MKVFRDAGVLALDSAVMLRDVICERPDSLCCFAAGRTQLATYSILAEWSSKGKVDLSRIRVIALDEIVGAASERREGFRYFLDQNFFLPAGIQDNQIFFINGCAPDMSAECARIDAWLDKNGPIDFLLLGIGDNGHIGYNEPGTDEMARTHVVRLAQTSIDAGRSYFDHAFTADIGVTLGPRDLLRARRILLQAVGCAKRATVEALRSGNISGEIPATLLLRRRDGVEYFVDWQAAGEE